MENSELNLNNALKNEREQLKKTGNKFPIEVFPKFYQEFINELGKTQDFNKEYLSIALLYVTSVAVGNKIQLRVNSNWVETASIYAAIVGKSGDGKTPAIKTMLSPLYEIDKKYYEIYQAEKKEYDAIGQDDDSSINKPLLKQCLMSDFTIEALLEMHARRKKGIGVYADELKGLFGQFNRYRRGNDEELFLQMFSGTPIILNRKTQEPIRITTPSVSVLGGLQPGLLRSIFYGQKTINGLIHRLLFVCQKNKKVKWSEREIDPSLLEAYNQRILKISEESNRFEEPIQIDFAYGIRGLVCRWQNINQDEFENDFERSSVIKLEQYLLRFCLLLHILKEFPGGHFSEGISYETVEDATKLYEFFNLNAMQIFDEMIAEPYDNLSQKKKKLYDLLDEEFETKDGIIIIKKYKLMSESTYKRFLRDRSLFKKIKQGTYQKIY